MTEPRAVILEAARSVLAEAGHRGFTIDAVAARAGVDRATVDDEWAGREDLVVDVLAEAMAIAEIPDTGDSRAELTTALRHMIGFYTDRQRFEPALLAFAADQAADQDLLRERCVRRSREQVGAALRRAAARGDLPPDVDTDLVQDVWAGTIAYRRLVSGGTITMDIVDPLLDLVLSGMAPLRAPDWPGGRPSAQPWPTWLLDSAEWLDQHAFGQVHSGQVPLRALAEIPATATVDGHPVTISATVWRDFMPVVTATSTALIVAVSVTAAGTGVLPPFLRADRLAVRHDDEVWVAPLSEENPRGRTSRKFQVNARQGPDWPTGTAVDVIVQLRGEHAERQLVRLADQVIERTE
ncbi:MAG TPA: TetR/AcrR family transcriptional regulator [Actinophytocola sp.]|nr:TetR/AcrR family transcriptional regulator [Actinophytocola sp.]